ncbi:hypothetical protein [Pseudomonas fluorescens]
MEKSDFEYDTDEFKTLISRTAHSYKRATDHYLELVDTWKNFSPEEFGGEVSFEVEREQSRVLGRVIGQKFNIRSTLLITNQSVYLRASITVLDALVDNESEIGSFLVSPNGSIHSKDGELLIDRNQHMIEYSLLVAVLRRVLGFTAKG